MEKRHPVQDLLMIFVGDDGLLGVEPIDKELDLVLAGGDVLPAAVGHRGQTFTPRIIS
jgi:hypothetical protein